MGIHKADENYRELIIYGSVPVKKYAHKDDELYHHIKRLFDNDRCKLIKKQDNYIYFQWWSSLYAGCGLLYSMDGEIPKKDEGIPTKDKEVIIEPLGYDNWYYYYGKWK